MKQLIIITGPTGSGKTNLAVRLAQELGCDIVSADSRQIYRGIPIGTAAPTAEQLSQVRHHMVGILDLDQYYSAALYEQQVMELLPTLWQHNDYVVMCGGSMMYIDAITQGIDELPTISPEIRTQVKGILENEGLETVRQMLQDLDPDYYNQVDRANARRVVHAVEICLQSGTTYSSLRTGKKVQRDFHIAEFAIDLTREQLFDRINHRVDAMVAQGLEQEAQRVYPLRHLNSLNTVGYKEMFAYFDGLMERDTAIARIAKNTRVYAKKQLLWMSKRPQLNMLEPESDLVGQVLQKL